MIENPAVPLVYGHRGASAAAPENTLEAYRMAAELGADGVELDVRRSADGALVLHHDAVLADGRVVSSTRRAELPASVPTLDAALDACAGLVVNIEIKNISWEPDFDPECRIADEVVALLVDRHLSDDVLVSSFHLATIDRVKATAPAVRTGFLTFVEPGPADAVALAAARGHEAVHPHEATVDEELVGAAHEAGVAVNAWTVDDPLRIGALAAMGVDGVVTNVPDVARSVLGPSPRT
jgi:glycerophosphoryl diester phosphodiesterase